MCDEPAIRVWHSSNEYNLTLHSVSHHVYSPQHSSRSSGAFLFQYIRRRPPHEEHVRRWWYWVLNVVRYVWHIRVFVHGYCKCKCVRRSRLCLWGPNKRFCLRVPKQRPYMNANVCACIKCREKNFIMIYTSAQSATTAPDEKIATKLP